MLTRIDRLRKAGPDFALCLAIGTFAVISTFMAGNRGVELFDMSIIVDGGWRIAQGQMPYRDFLMPVGPIVFYIQAAFLKLMGFSWRSLLVHVATASVIAVTSTYLICRQWHSRGVSTLLALLGAVTFYLPMAFPWHDNTAFLFLLLAFLVLEQQGNKRRTYQVGAGLVLGGLVGLSILSKHNVGFAAFGVVLFVLLFDAYLSRQHEGSLPKGSLPMVWGYLLGSLLSVGGVSAYWSFGARGTLLNSIATSSAAVSRVFFFLSVRRHIADLLLPGRLILNTSTWLFFLAVLLSLWILVANRSLFKEQGALLVRVASLSLLHVFVRQTGAGHWIMHQELLGILMGYLLYLARQMTYWPKDVWQLGPSQIRGFFGGLGSLLISLGLLDMIAESRLSVDRPPKILLLPFNLVASERMIPSFLVLLGLMILGVSLGPHRLLWSLQSRLRNACRNVVRGLGSYIGTGPSLLSIYGVLVGYVVLCLAIYLHWGYRRKAWEFYPGFRNLTYEIQASAFLGLLVRPEIGTVIDQAIEFVDAEVAPNETLLLFPKGQMLYGAAGHSSPKGVHLWYDIGLTHVEQDVDTQTIMSLRPDWILKERDWGPAARGFNTTDDVIRTMPIPADWIEENYEHVVELSGYTVLRFRRPH